VAEKSLAADVVDENAASRGCRHHVAWPGRPFLIEVSCALTCCCCPSAAGATGIAAWTATLTPAARIDPTGGAYWLVTGVRNDTHVAEWVFDPHNTPIDRVEVHLFGLEDSVQKVHTGVQASREYFLDYGKNVRLEPQRQYQLVTRFSSPYSIRAPVVALLPQAEFAPSSFAKTCRSSPRSAPWRRWRSSTASSSHSRATAPPCITRCTC
jgi:hypothetical protein